jgi:hypothetical protein
MTSAGLIIVKLVGGSMLKLDGSVMDGILVGWGLPQSTPGDVLTNFVSSGFLIYLSLKPFNGFRNGLGGRGC